MIDKEHRTIRKMKKAIVLLMTGFLLISATGDVSALMITENLDKVFLLQQEGNEYDAYLTYTDQTSDFFASALKDGKSFLVENFLGVAEDFFTLTFERDHLFLEGQILFEKFDFDLEGLFVRDLSNDKNFLFQVTDVQADPVPEPATIFLIGLGLFGLIGWKKKSKG